jgi:hypothetical protein
LGPVAAPSWASEEEPSRPQDQVLQCQDDGSWNESVSGGTKSASPSPGSSDHDEFDLVRASVDGYGCRAADPVWDR